MIETKNKIYSINGPIIKIQGPTDFSMAELVYVGNDRLIGEVIGIDRFKTTIQVYEDTNGLKPGEPIEGSNESMAVELGPGMLDNIFDGIERPLKEIQNLSGAYIKGINIDSLNREKVWKVTPLISVGNSKWWRDYS